MILVIDNYDSFTYNLVQYLGELGQEIVVKRNDGIALTEIADLAPDHILLSPGPCTPSEAGICLPLIERFAGEIPILGVCLGHQAIGQAFGGKIIRAGKLMHGKTSPISHDGTGVLSNIPSPFTAIRYHSLVIEPDSFPDSLLATARSDDSEVMAVRHKTLNVHGVQFHPESVLTEHGHRILKNFLGESS